MRVTPVLLAAPLVASVVKLGGFSLAAFPLRSRGRQIHLCPEPSELVELLLYDPKDSETPFAFPSLPTNLEGDSEVPTCSYCFDRPVHMRLVQDAQDCDGDDTFFGHCIKPGEGEVVGSLALGQVCRA